MLARLTRFYRIDPERILEMPQYLVAILCEQLPPLEAAEQLGAVQAAIVPHMRDDARRSTIRELEAIARSLMPRQEPQPMPKVGHDPQAAAEWFRAMGVEVIEGSHA